MKALLLFKYYCIIACALFITIFNANAQIITTTPSQNAYKISQEKLAHYKSIEAQFAGNNGGTASVVSNTGIDYDVKYYRLELRINPDTLGGGAAGKYVKGKITTYFTTKISNFTAVNFDFGTPLTCDSVYYHGAKLAAGQIVRPTDLLQLTIPNIAASGTLDSISVYYKGVPQVEPLFGSGYINTKHNTTQNYTYTLSEPYSAFTWWPCKSYIANDKADSVDLFISTPLGFKAAGNGTLVSETTTASGVTAFWKERYPISSYQICTAVANYVQYPSPADTVIIGGVKMPHFNYIFPETNSAAARTALDRDTTSLRVYSALYGDYPFKNEKYGNYTFGFGGGMEHNTFSGENASVYNNASDWDVLAHELAHQWFGASVTCGSWKDIWVNESFADYSEALLLEFAPAIAASVATTDSTWRSAKKTATIGANAQSTYVSDTSTIATIFSPSVYIYDRGGLIISMMRMTLGDTKFFQAIKNYQADPLLKYGNGLTNDVKRHMENASGLNFNTFFNNWLYNTGYATYNPLTVAGAVCEWNNSGNNIVLKLVQKTKSSAISHFDMPVVVRIKGSVGGQDTTVVIYDAGGILSYAKDGVLTSTGSNLINFRLSFTPTTILFDSKHQTIATGSFTKNASLPITVLATNIISFTANKEAEAVKLAWNIDNGLDYIAFEIQRSTNGTFFEKIGTINAIDNPNKYNFNFSDNNLLSGISYYRIKIIQKDGGIIYTRIINILNKLGNYFTITPNPAKDYIVISCGSLLKQKADIRIFDAAGRMVKKIASLNFTNNSAQQILVRDLESGNYFVEIQLVDGNKISKQISIIR
jgi:hypothetical protein